jgi:hypothetical protein
MEYNKIVAVTGLPGLYELLASKTDGAIVRSLDDKSTKFVSSRIHNFSHLESIEVFTKRENVNLIEVLKAIEESKEKLPDEKDNAALKKYFGKVYPEIDFDRVYTSDLKKMIKWFSVLKSNNIEFKLSEPAPDEKEAVVEKPVEKIKVEKLVPEPPAAKPKKAAAKKGKEEDKKETKKEVEVKTKKAAAKKKSAKK